MQVADQNVDPLLTNAPKAQTRPFYLVLLPVVYGLILLVVFFLSYSRVFDKKIDLNGDDTCYYLLGKAIASGKGYTNTHELGSPAHNHFPPGYPAIIAVICTFFSDDLIFIKQVNGFFLLASIVLLCFITWKLRRNIHITFLVALFSLLNSHLLEYSVNTMSEIPFLFFTLLCILIALNTRFEKPVFENFLFGLLIICISFTYHVRTAGISLFIGLLAFLLLKKNWSYAVASLVGFVLLALPWYLRGKNLGGNSYLSQLGKKSAYRPELGQMKITDWLQRIWHNLVRYITQEIPSCMTGVSIDYDVPAAAGEIVKGGVMVCLILFGLFMLKHKAKSMLIFFILAYGAILLLWPDVWVGVRFLLPLFPVLLFLMITGLFETFQWTLSKTKVKYHQAIAVAAMMVVSAFLLRPYIRPMDELKKEANNKFPAAYKNYFDLAEWTKQHTPDSAVICCRKKELFYVYSHRIVASFLSTLNTEEQLAYLQKSGIDYVVVEDLGFADTERYLVPVTKKYPNKFKLIKFIKNPDTYLLQVLH